MTTHVTADASGSLAAQRSDGPAEQLLIRRAGIHDAATVRELLLELADYEPTDRMCHPSCGRATAAAIPGALVENASPAPERGWPQ